MHGGAIFIKPPLRVRTQDKAALGIPASDPVDSIVEKEKAQLFWALPLVQWGVKPAAALL